jgi:hypothetical protein
MATEHNQNTKSMNSLESNTSNTIANDTDRKYSLQDKKCEITTNKHQNDIQINETTKCNDRKIESWEFVRLLSFANCGEARVRKFRLEEEAWEKKFDSIKVVVEKD